MELSEQEIARTIDVWGTGRKEDAEEYAFLRHDKQNADQSLPLTKEQVFRDLFEAEGSPYWRLKQVMDAGARCGSGRWTKWGCWTGRTRSTKRLRW